jgi:hypothetical protein
MITIHLIYIQEVSTTKINQLLLYRDIVGIYYEDYTQQINTFEQNFSVSNTECGTFCYY